MNLRTASLSTLLLLIPITAAASDSLELKKHSPRGAAIRSALVPGLGQAYNRKYWKIPIIYAGLGSLGYAIRFNYTNFDQFRDAFILRTDGDTSTRDSYELYSEDQLLKITSYYRRNLDLSVAGAGLLYLANIIDALVDAHLTGFNVSDDLAIQISPSFIFAGTGIMIRLRL